MKDAKLARVAELEAELRRLRSELRDQDALTGNDREPAIPLPPEHEHAGWLGAVERLAQLGNWSWDPVTGTAVWSLGVFRIFQLDPTQTQASPALFLACLHPDDRQRVAEAAQRSVSTGVMAPVEARVLRPSGELREVLLEGSFVTVAEQSGQRQQMVGSLLDLTDQRRSAERLARAITELNDAQKLAKLGSWRVDLRTGQTEWSTQLYELLGVSQALTPSDELFFERVHPEEQPRLVALRAQAKRTGVVEPFESRLVHTSGRVLHVMYHAAPQTDASGATIAYRGVIQDITERKALEEQLRHSQKMEAIGTLAGGVAHDFNNYLTVIAGHADRLRKQLPETHPAHTAVREIAQAYQRCAHLTQQLLTLSRKRQGQPRQVNLAALVEQLSTLIASALGVMVELCLDLPTNEALIFADPLQVEHLLMNLVVNARDAMPSGGKLTIGVRPHIQGPDERRMVRLTVSDTGCGIPSELHSRVFEPFFTTKQVGQGTGLGLSTVYAVVHEGNAQIALDSAPGRGTTFHIDWSEHTATPAAAIEAIKPLVAAESDKRTVLLVEDVRELREVLKLQLESCGYQVLCAAHGLEALAQLEEQQVDLVLSDLIMPQLGGAKLAETLQRQYPNVRCVLMTGYYAESMPAAYRGRILRKPFTTQELLDSLDAALQPSGPASPPAGAGREGCPPAAPPAPPHPGR